MSILFSFCRYVFRCLHLLGFSMIFGNLFHDSLFLPRFPEENTKYFQINLIFQICLIVSGFINFLLIIYSNKYKKNFHYELWKIFIFVKLILAVLITPIFEICLELIFKENKLLINTKALRLYVYLGIILLSIFLRYYREQFLFIETKNYPEDRNYVIELETQEM